MKVLIMKFATILPLALLTSLMLGQVAKADLILTINSSDLSAGGDGIIDVLISSSTGTDKLGKFSASFAITQLSGTGVLSFKPSYSAGDPSNPANQSASERSSSSPSYVFAGNLAAGFAASSTGTRQTILQVDRASVDVTLSTTPVLLARLELMHSTPAADQPASYRIDLQNTPSTRFQLLDNSSAALSPGFFSSFGAVSISAVPEPTTCLLFGATGALLMLRQRRKRHS